MPHLTTLCKIPIDLESDNMYLDLDVIFIKCN